MPIGAFVAGEKVEEGIAVGDHGFTYGGNPLATAKQRMLYLTCLKAVIFLTMSMK